MFSPARSSFTWLSSILLLATANPVAGQVATSHDAAQQDTEGRILIAIQDFDQHNNALPGSFTPTFDNLSAGAGDFWGVGNRNNWPQGFPVPGVPVRISDDTVFDYSGNGVNPSDDQGIFGQNADLDNAYFAISDSSIFGHGEIGQYGDGQRAVWYFDTTYYTDLAFSVDIGADLDDTSYYAQNTYVQFTAQVGDGPSQRLLRFTRVDNTVTPVIARPLDNGRNDDTAHILRASGDAPITKTFAEGKASTNVVDLYLDKSDLANGKLDTFHTTIENNEGLLKLTVTAEMDLHAVVFDNMRLYGRLDCDTNGNVDIDEITGGSSLDCNTNGIPDHCELTNPQAIPHEVTSALDDPVDLAVGDIDRDGDADVVVASYSDNKVAWIENVDGFGAFGPTHLIATVNRPTVLSLVDIEGDKDLDVFILHHKDNGITRNISAYKNTSGDGQYQGGVIADPLPVSGGTVPPMATSDLNGDGTIDVCYIFSAYLMWIPYSSYHGSFGIRQQLDEYVFNVNFLHTADLDGDQDADILFANAYDNRIYWYENDGFGDFNAKRIVSNSATGVDELRTADIDGDGDLDILSASDATGTIIWFENINGVGEFGAGQFLDTQTTSVSSIAASDMDGDGDLDILYAAPNEDLVAWMENEDGDGAFSPPILISRHTVAPEAVVTADLDGNGIAEPVSAASGIVAWYEFTEPFSADCNLNDVPDDCDIAQAVSLDCTGNGIPDECEPDCNANLIADSCDVLYGNDTDCNTNGIPDSCDPDCNANGYPDSCDLALGSSVDCNGNNQPDTCDITAGSSDDCNSNAVPDECEPDCDGDGLLDECAIASLRSLDCNENAIPDECDVVGMEQMLIGEFQGADVTSSDRYANSIAIDGHTVLIGAPFDDIGANNSGSVYVFEFDGHDWMQVAKLSAADPGANAQFGVSVAIDGDIAAIGAPADSENVPFSGAVYIFERNGETWQQVAKFKRESPATGDFFGLTVAVNGIHVAAGAPDADPMQNEQVVQDAGSVDLFSKNVGDGWQRTASLVAHDARTNDSFGASIALDHGVALIGASGRHSTQYALARGAVYVFEDSNDTWTETTILTASEGAGGDEFGSSVALAEGVALIGSWQDNDIVTHGGSAYVFEQADGLWNEVAKLTAPDAQDEDRLGTSVAFDGITAVAGAPGDPSGDASNGATYVFRKVAGTWEFISKLTADGPIANDRFGVSIAVEKSLIVAGALGDDLGNGNVAYLFTSVNDCNANRVPDACDSDCNLNALPDDCEEFAFGDFDQDSSVSVTDVRAFVACLGGPLASPQPLDAACADTCLRVFDADSDGDVDLLDFQAIETLVAQP